MQATNVTARRIQVLLRILQHSKLRVSSLNCRGLASIGDSISIGDVQTNITKATYPEYVPRQFYQNKAGQTTLHHLRWIMQKDILGQDMFLIGSPGPKRRNLALQYLQLTNKELEYVALSRDTTESDLKQRREIVDGCAVYFDQSAVRAATEGRILILEGIDKAERNVLPVLNNLLENREMQLEDGRMLIPSHKYDKLLEKYKKEELDRWKLVRVHENFRIIAIGLPVPKYMGNPLDPPLRSRFQARNIGNGEYYEWLQELKLLTPSVPSDKIENLLGAAFALLSNESASLGMPDFPIDNLLPAAKILENDPTLSISNIFHRLYPYELFLKDNKNAIEVLLNKFGIKSTLDTNTSNNLHNKIGKADDFYIETEYQNSLIQNIIHSNSVADFCLIGPKGCGKNIVVSKMADILNQEIESIVLYQDMTSRDLIQQRSTLTNGDTVWKLSPLVNAAVKGKIAVVDGINRIHSSTLSVLHRLVHDRELQLHDGRRMISFTKFEELKNELNMSDEELQKKGILKIHPKFRIIALGEPPSSQNTANWLSSEALTLFLFHNIRMLNKSEELHIINSKFGSASTTLQKLLDLAHVLRNHSDPTLQNLAGHLSTRQLLRIAAKLNKFPSDDAYDIVETTFMMKFLPSLTLQALENILHKMEIKPKQSKENILSKIGIKTSESDIVKCEVIDNVLTIGSTSSPIYQTDDITKVPSIVFYNVPQHVQLMEKLLQDFQLGFHLLLVGNQGVGKNKIVDRFLQLLNRPREYIQLHRDTTVHSLTVQPTIRNGILTYVDSPLVEAVKYGRVLVVDEADKAPTHVTCILKTLVESGQMNLSDGRKIINKVKSDNDGSYISIHPDFRMIVLANRPGFPFLGNDFFGALGDLFSSHAVHNPSAESEVNLLKYYGPSVPQDTINKLVNIFGELRLMADQGLVSYPYSTREVVNIVKHLEQFPNANLEDTLLNVFDFDKYSRDVLQTLGDVLSKHGFSKIFTDEYLASKRSKEHLELDVKSKSGKDAKSPKHGKEDPKNEPHVGGNTWAGGTGGRDTAGLGGKGGPYRLDKGHKVHQLSDEEKNALPDHIKQAAMEMNRRAFKEKLAEIGMSEYDASLYSQFSNAVSRQVQSLRVILDSLQTKSKERQWSRHQTSGEMDDNKLIDGLLGEKNIYRRRKEHEPEMGSPQVKPKILRLVVDVSGSMYRFNSYDGRLDRQLEAVVLLMEALEGFQTKISYDIIGHSGESHDIKFVKLNDPPKNNKERLDVLRTMHAHSQFCFSGDNTLEATELAIKSLADEECDEAIVVILSDANLQRYGIRPSELAKALTSSSKVNAHVVFIGSLGNQAATLTRSLPAGKSFICDDVSNLPQILKQIFSSSIMTI